MAVQPIPTAKFRAFDSNGDPLSGGLLYSYAAGTSTPLATYTTRAGDVANANPVVLDANGEANVWLSSGVDYKLELRNSAGVVQWTVDNVPSPAEASTTDNVAINPGGRITIVDGDTAQNTAANASTVYYQAHVHNKVPLYDGTSWALYSIGDGLSQTTADTTYSPAAVVADSCYDIFVWNDGGTIRMSRGPVWTSDTDRGSGAGTTELERLDGRWVNAVSITNGPAAQRGLYVGTIRSDGSALINDTYAKRHVWNTYNRVVRSLIQGDTTDTWTYSTAAWRQANNSTSNQIDVVVGLREDVLWLHATVYVINNTATGRTVRVGIGYDSITSALLGSQRHSVITSTAPAVIEANFVESLPIGRHYLAWLEYGGGADTQTWSGDGGGITTSGMKGTFPC